MKALVISGGGSKGAFAGGVAEYLINHEKQEYDIFAGCSTGSLLVPFLASGEIEQIKKAYTSVTQKDIYTICPFTIKELPNGSVISKINHINTIRMFVRRQKTFGDTRALRSTIGNMFQKEDFDKLKRSSKQIVINVSNLSTNRMENKYLHDCEYEDFCDWMWASTSFVPFMSLVEKNGYDYADGGFGDYVPMEAVLDAGATEIDVIILNPKDHQVNKSKALNPFDVLINTMDFMMDQIVSDDIYQGYLESIYNKNVKIRFFHTPRVLTTQSFYFSPAQMSEWWQEGIDFAKETIHGNNSK